MCVCVCVFRQLNEYVVNLIKKRIADKHTGSDGRCVRRARRCATDRRSRTDRVSCRPLAVRRCARGAECARRPTAALRAGDILDKIISSAIAAGEVGRCRLRLEQACL